MHTGVRVRRVEGEAAMEIKKTVIREEERTNRRPAIMEKRPTR
ncbi:hypothetical protein ACIRF8_01785 [Streptomyces sp. NPDC102406]